MNRLTLAVLVLLFQSIFVMGDDPDNQHFLSLRRNQGRVVGSNTSYTTLEGLSFFSSNQNFVPFFNCCIHQFDRANEHAANIGGGVRMQADPSGAIFGINAYCDYRKDQHLSYNQVGIGFEFLGQIWGFRLNGYHPVGNKRHLRSSCFFNDYIGNYFFQKDTYLESLKGINFEIESLIADRSWGDIRLGLGAYYYHRKKGCRTNICGPACRLSSNFGRYFNLNVLASYDPVFKARGQVQLGITVPFYFEGNRSYLGTRGTGIYRPVERNDLMVLKSQKHYTWNWDFCE